MIYCYPEIDGKKSREWFYDNWDEVPINIFIDYMNLSKKASPIEAELKAIYDNIVDLSDKIAVKKYKGHVSASTRLQMKLKRLHEKSAAIQSKYDDIVFTMVCLFTSIEAAELAKFEFDAKKDVDDNHFLAYRSRLEMLVACPLPDENISCFEFQSSTDEEIKDMESKYNALSRFGKLSKKGRLLRKQIELAKKSTYVIKDIWLQTTMANKYFQDKANEIVEQIQGDVFDNLPFLAALLVTESNQDEKALESIKNSANNAYLEKYREEYLKCFKYRLKVFTEQKNKLSIGVLKRIANFFLSSLKT